MNPRLVELDWQQTPIGAISLRRRQDAVLGEVFEAKLDDEFLMSTAFTASETELSTAVLGMLDGEGWRVLVGGLGLGYTAVTALADERVASVHVVEALAPVIDWHRRRLLPVSDPLVADRRTVLVHADFFAVVAGRAEAAGVSDCQFDAVLLDIDHTPGHVLSESHRPFYTATGLARLRALLRPGGVVGVWSDDPPDEVFLAALREVFVDVSARVVTFPNPLTGGESSCTVHLARREEVAVRAYGGGTDDEGIDP